MPSGVVTRNGHRGDRASDASPPSMPRRLVSLTMLRRGSRPRGSGFKTYSAAAPPASTNLARRARHTTAWIKTQTFDPMSDRSGWSSSFLQRRHLGYARCRVPLPGK
jgi:hypothetical protein